MKHLAYLSRLLNVQVIGATLKMDSLSGAREAVYPA
jgi:hypothetical protein